MLWKLFFHAMETPRPARPRTGAYYNFAQPFPSSAPNGRSYNRSALLQLRPPGAAYRSALLQLRPPGAALNM